MLDGIEKLMRKIPAPHGRNAGVAAALGFVFGGIGLAIYFRNIIDLVLPVAIAVLSAALLGDISENIAWLAGAIVSSLYGYFRVVVADEVEREKLAAGPVAHH